MLLSRRGSRAGFTLVELIVTMSVMILLASLALVVVPDIMSQDRTTEGAARLQQHLLIAKSRAARDGLPRGILLLPDANNFATELQYIEAPPLYVPTNSSNPYFDLPQSPATSSGAPRVEFQFDPAKNPNWTIIMKNLPSDAPVSTGAIVICPVLSVWFSIGSYDSSTGIVTLRANPTTIAGVTPFPDIGSGTSVETYQFGIFGPPQPLLGEPVQQMPSNICVDVGQSDISTPGNQILFTPSGDVMDAAKAQIFMWVRDKTKPANLTSGGEQQVVSVKTRTGSIGVSPISWTSGNPFQFAQSSTGGS